MTAIHSIVALSLAAWGADLAIPTGSANTSGEMLSFEFQNDAIAGTDRHYTSGFETVWTSWKRDAYAISLGYDHAFSYQTPTPGRLATSGGEAITFRSFAVGQKIYTPSDLSSDRYDPLDRPYAGWTYIRFDFETAATGVRKRMALEAGTFGPDSMAGDVQGSIHDLIGSASPNGWSHQIQNEPAFNLILEREKRVASRRLAGDYRFVASSAERITLGSANTELQLGIVTRLDRNATNQRSPKLAYFSKAALSIVGRDRSLSGPLPEGFGRVRKSSRVGMLEMGFEYKTRSGSLSFSVTRLGRQFEGQSKPHYFGTLRYTFW